MTIDLAVFDEAIQRQENGIPLPILGMDGKTLTGITITVCGPDSARNRKAREELHQELVDAQRIDPLDAAEVSLQGAKLLAKLTLGWAPNLVVDGKELECTEANAVLIYERYRFIREQVDKAAGSRAAFMPASSGSSATPSAKPLRGARRNSRK